jgi:hypothetical protein
MASLGRCVRRLPQAGLVGAVLLVTGCSYFQNRLDDAERTLDVGVTVSSKPGFSLYIGFLNIAALGYSHVDGHIIGLGGGHAGYLPMRQRAVGLLLWGKEEYGYVDFDPEDPENPPSWRVGIIGLIDGPGPSDGSIVNCPKLLHLGWIGLTLNCKFAEIADFILGWTTFDLMGNDTAGKAAPAQASKGPAAQAGERPAPAAGEPGGM